MYDILIELDNQQAHDTESQGCHVAVDSDLLDIHWQLDPDDAPDWRELTDDTAPPMTPEQERRMWIKIACAIAARREA